MSSKVSHPKLPSATDGDGVRPTPKYEPPRILSKRSVERVTLLSQVVPGPGGPIGGE